MKWIQRYTRKRTKPKNGTHQGYMRDWRDRCSRNAKKLRREDRNESRAQVFQRMSLKLYPWQEEALLRLTTRERCMSPFQ